MIVTLINLTITAIGIVGIILLSMFTSYVIISYTMGED